jgi:uncharacterized protein (TIGR02391 family)
MYELRKAIPDVEVLLALPPEELGRAILFLLKARTPRDFNVGNMVIELRQATVDGRHPYGHRADAASEAFVEALAWLESENLIVRSTEQDGDRGWRRLSRRALDLESVEDFARYRVGRLLPKELLHPSIADDVWLSFVGGKYDTAVFQAMRQVEIALREASGSEGDGVRMARKAFSPDGGPLTDAEAEAGERQGIMDLFAGALGALKNPHSHRLVDFESPADPAAVVLFASYLLRLIDQRAAMTADAKP